MEPQRAISEQVVSALRGITRALDLHYRQLLREYGLSGPQIVVLKAVQANGPCPISEVSRVVRLSHATVSDILGRLERKGLVRRSPNLQDRRQVFISLTEEGTKTVARLPALLHENFVAEFTSLELWERNQILSSLQRVAKMIGASESAAPVLSIAPLGEEEQDSRVVPAHRPQKSQNPMRW